jgi:hypothetical protein
MGIIVCVGKMCRKCGQAFAVTREEIQLAKRGKKREPRLCPECRK